MEENFGHHAGEPKDVRRQLCEEFDEGVKEMVAATVLPDQPEFIFDEEAAGWQEEVDKKTASLSPSTPPKLQRMDSASILHGYKVEGDDGDDGDDVCKCWLNQTHNKKA